jgi:ADP-ribose pyrophosphatase YjhB (NUDIX family)
MHENAMQTASADAIMSLCLPVTARRVPLSTDLARFLATQTPLASELDVWGEGTLPLRITAYWGQEMPPPAYVTSVRAMVFRAGEVLVLRNADGPHVLPGGRREVGESLTATLCRELGEETGWRPCALQPLGFCRLQHLSPRPAAYPYPYPDFCWLIYRAEAGAFDAAARLADDYEQDARFYPPAAALALPLGPVQRALLERAVNDVPLHVRPYVLNGSVGSRNLLGTARAKDERVRREESRGSG